MLYQASIIYSRSSMWPSQRAEDSASDETQLGQCISGILELSQHYIQTNRPHLRFVVFPLFLAGFASNMAEQKMLALQLIKSFESHSAGRNTTTIRKLLQVVFQRQRQSLTDFGTPWTVDWTEVMREERLEVVNFGF